MRLALFVGALLMLVQASAAAAQAVVGSAIAGLPGGVWADRNNDGYVDGYVYNGQYYPGTPTAAQQQPPSTSRSYVGVGLQTVDANLAEAVGVGEGTGEIVRSVVPGGTGERAGIQQGDIITAINGWSVSQAQNVAKLIARIPVGSPISFEIVRGTQRLQLTGVTSPRPTEQEIAAMSASTTPTAGNASVQVTPSDFTAGLGLATLTESLAGAFRLPAGTRGALLAEVQPGSAAYQAGLRRGDALISVGRVVTPDSASAKTAIEDAFSKNGPALLLVRRANEPPAFLGLRGEATPVLAGNVAQSLPAISISAPEPGKMASAGPRYALIIGNSQYGALLGRLPNPVNDAQSVAAALRAVGFNVDLVTDADQRTMKRAISRFGERLSSARGATGLFYYAGHGIQSRGTNYLIPVSAPIEREPDLDLEAVAADTVLAQMEDAGAATSIVILDACRNMPLARSFRSSSRGLARMDAPNGSFIAYSTAPGATAADGDGRNSPFAAALVRQIGQKGLPIEVMFRGIRKDVLQATGGQQTPWDSSSLVDPFYFVP